MQPEQQRWVRELEERQRNFVFPDTARNGGNFWRGILENSLNGFQIIGLVILILFYVLLMAGLIFDTWPRGDGSVWQKLISGYSIYLLFVLPLILFFWLLRRNVRREADRLTAARTNDKRDVP